jgi:C4-dicarboxylate-binding protein DctP
MKRQAVILGILAMFAFSSFLGGGVPTAAAAGKSWVLRFSTGFSPTSTFAKESKWYFDNIVEQSGGRIKVEYYFGGALAKLGEELNAMRAHAIDLACATPPYFAPQVPLVDVLNMNYVTTAVDAHMKAAQEVYDAYAPLHDEFEKDNNAKILWNLPVTNNTLWSNFAVPDIAAFKGKRIRALGRTGEDITLFGGAPVGILWGDIYTSAQKGIIQGAFGTPLALGWDSKFYEVMPYVTQTGSGVFGSQVMMIRKDLYDEFPPDLKQLFHDWARKAEEKSVEIVEEENRRAADDMEARGIKLMIWSRPEQEKARALVQPMQFDSWVKKMGERGLGKEAQTLKDMYVQAVRKYEKTSKYQSAFDYWNQKYKKGF